MSMIESAKAISPARKIAAVRSLIRHSCELVRHQREIERTTGANFNLFQIFGVGHYEVSTHSPLLGDLLNPRGSHGQGAVFLNCFVKILRDTPALWLPKALDSFDAESAQVLLEHSLGPRTETTGGRLDIFITDKRGNQIAVENKIHAGEQENWVRRYRDGLRSDACLIYLTLNGDDPSQIDEDLREEVVCISYASSVVQWLTACRKEVATVPIVRESLTQYIHLIQTLTHQNPDSRMNDEITKFVLDDEDNYQAFCALRDADSAIRSKIIRDLVERIRDKLPAGFSLISAPAGYGEKGEAFYFSTPELKQANLYAAIEFDYKNYGQCFYGFCVIDPDRPFDEDSAVRQTIFKHFKKTFADGKCESTGHWPAWQYWSTMQHWNDDVFQTIAFKQKEFDQALLSRINDLFHVSEAFAEKEGPTASLEQK